MKEDCITSKICDEVSNPPVFVNSALERTTREKLRDSDAEKESRLSTHNVHSKDEEEHQHTRTTEVVDWKCENDPQKPINWSNARKAKNIIVICYCTFLTPLGSTMFAPAIPQVMATYHSSDPLLASFVVSVWVLGYFFGPLFLGPLSELYGRLPVYMACNALFTVFNIATAVSPSLSALIVFRFLAGTFGGGPITIGAGTFGDCIKPENRGKVIAIWSLGPLMGPILGPIAGGYLGQSLGWRWICWVLSIAAGLGTIACFIFQEETYPPTLLDRNVKRLRKETGNPSLQSAFYVDRKPSHLFARGIIRPLRLLFLSPIVAILSLYQGIIYGYLYLLFTTFPIVFRDQYGFGTGTIGLTYLGMGTGSLIGLVAAGSVSDRLLKKLAVEGRYKPEYRLPPLIPACFFIPVGLFWYGWAADAKAHWIVPIMGTVFIGIGVNTLMMCVSTYFIDAHPLHEASAIAASTAVRSLIGALVPLAGRSMYRAMGLGWGNSLLGFLALAMCPLPFYFYKYGERIRTNPRFQLKL
ncbi:MFS general substrate transporter [Melanomma pulvis-pyrius CBS 109.77]|uniref:MFS general substrate transporter n=1 Tax=Melanomma pulvis-pyrius CBS 109.77 TaxID=1314802 RepID=A0A6A6XAF9_9PLEO|nr:MFS general substrate transporter [Melanomma pulvis-pyrius CBS 109.77]